MAEEIVTARIVFEDGTSPSPGGAGAGKELGEISKTLKKSLSGSLTGLLGGAGDVAKTALAAVTGAAAAATIASIAAAALSTAVVAGAITLIVNDFLGRDIQQKKEEGLLDPDTPEGIRGVPSVFNQAISGFADFERLEEALQAGDIGTIAVDMGITLDKAQLLVDEYRAFKDDDTTFIEFSKEAWNTIVNTIGLKNLAIDDGTSAISREIEEQNKFTDAIQGSIDKQTELNRLKGGQERSNEFNLRAIPFGGLVENVIDLFKK